LCIPCVEEMKKEYEELKDYTYSTDMSDLVLTDTKGVKYLANTMERKIDILTSLGCELQIVTCVCTLCRKYDLPSYFKMQKENVCRECFLALVSSQENLEAFNSSSRVSKYEKARTMKQIKNLVEALMIVTKETPAKTENEPIAESK